MKANRKVRRELGTEAYLRRRFVRRIIGSTLFTILIATVIAANVRSSGDDWSRFDHCTLRVISATSGDSLTVSIGGDHTEVVQLIGAVAPPESQEWLNKQTAGKQATLLLQTPQTRDAEKHLLAFAFVDNKNLSVEIVRAGMAYADRRSTCEMDGAIDSAEAEARKKEARVVG